MMDNDAASHKAKCKGTLMAIRDTMDVLSGKWKINIVGTLMAHEKLRFMDLLREVEGIAAKMLSKELQELETNKLIIRTVQNTKPITVVYELTEHGKTLHPIINAIADWGIEHRQELFG